MVNITILSRKLLYNILIKLYNYKIEFYITFYRVL